MGTCIFCSIATKKVPADIVYEDEHTLAFLDAKPANPGHTLIIPKKHTENIFDIDAESWEHMARAARRVAPKVVEGTSAHGLNLIVNNGGAASQLVFHAHMHLVPRFEGDGLTSWHGRSYVGNESAMIAEKIRNAHTLSPT
ncbi:MAG TPA: HIT family protein [Candidatus Paceibacterota bacterium]